VNPTFLKRGFLHPFGAEEPRRGGRRRAVAMPLLVLQRIQVRALRKLGGNISAFLSLVITIIAPSPPKAIM